MYKAISITYLKGYNSSYISDYIYFPNKTITSDKHQPWLISKKINHLRLPEFIRPVNDSLETVAFLVVKNDSIVFEKYWHGYSEDSMSNSFSMAKSWVSTLIGVAIKDGSISNVDQKVCDFIPSFCNGKNAELSIKNLLTMSSGLNWNENYYNPFGKTAEAYYGSNLKNLILTLNVIKTPGKTFNYTSASTQLLTFILEKATKKTISEYASEKLWIPLGAKHPALWGTDIKNGDEKGFCCINSNIRDFARLGKLYMNYGNWNGCQLLDSNYIIDAISPANLITEKGIANVIYGYHFWLTKKNGCDVYYARGLWGQYVICIPKKNLLIARLGKKSGKILGDGHYSDLDDFIDAGIHVSP